MRHRGSFAGLAVLALLAAGVVLAQRRDEGGGQELLPNAAYDGAFTFVRIRFTPGGGGGFGRGRGGRDGMWNHDYPRAELHFGKILDEVSLTRTYLGGGNVLTLDDPELFKFPVAYLTEPGFWTVTDAEAAGLRNWLLKGGFLIVDDFAGNHWFNFEEKIRIVLPEARLVRLDVSHPIFDSFFRIESLELAHPYYGVMSEFWGIYEDNDPAQRLMVIVNYNNDIAEYWEWSDEDFAPIELTNEAYKLGVNYVIYAMTH
jgi:hypothetical protein